MTSRAPLGSASVDPYRGPLDDSITGVVEGGQRPDLGEVVQLLGIELRHQLGVGVFVDPHRCIGRRLARIEEPPEGEAP